jgi:hypothetical protein
MDWYAFEYIEEDECCRGDGGDGDGCVDQESEVLVGREYSEIEPKHRDFGQEVRDVKILQCVNNTG